MRTGWGYRAGLMALVGTLLTACGGGGDDWSLTEDALAMAGADEWLEVASSRSDRIDERPQVLNEGRPGGPLVPRWGGRGAAHRARCFRPIPCQQGHAHAVQYLGQAGLIQHHLYAGKRLA